MVDVEQLCSEAIQELVSTIADRIVSQIRESQGTALVVYTGAKIGCAEATAQLRSLRENHGFSYKVLISESAASVLDVDAIDEALLPEDLWIGEPAAPGATLARQASTIIVPALSANTCSHVANVFTDTPAQEAIVEGLMLGRTVIAAVDGCCPDNVERAKLGFRFPPAMAERMRANRDALREFGAVLTVASNLERKVLKVQAREISKFLGSALSAPVEEAEAKASCQVPAASRAPEVTYGGSKVLSANFIRSQAAGTTVSVPSGTLVTQLARDVARTSGVTIVEGR